jgi:hypothetical protein
MEVVHHAGKLAFLTYDDESTAGAGRDAGRRRCAAGARGPTTSRTRSARWATSCRPQAAGGQGIQPAWPINHGLTTSLYYADPQGCRVEFQVENFDTPAKLRAFMESDVFAKNPIGVVFDPDKLVARYENGDPIEELLRQGSAP